jgi:hypothetical protein
MSDGTKEDDIRDVMAEEKRRGKRPVDAEALRQRRRYLADLREALSAKTEAEFRIAMLALGLDEKSEDFAEALRIWRAASSSRRR